MGMMTDRKGVLRTDDVVGKLRAACSEAGGQKAWALSCGVSPQYITDILYGRRVPGDSVLRGLGLQRDEPAYVPREPEEVALCDQDGATLLVATATWGDRA